VHERVDRFSWTERLDCDSGGIVPYVTLESLLGSQTVDPRTKADALNHTTNLDPSPHAGRRVGNSRHGCSESESTYAVMSQASSSLNAFQFGIGVPGTPSRIA
jgi:hypothetical protein